MTLLDLSTGGSGSITAPAGCGKTQLIVEAVLRTSESKPPLILTHTNAGKYALSSRLRQGRVPARAFRLHTLDSWAARIVRSFPLRSGIRGDFDRADDDAGKFYTAVREAAVRLLAGKHLDEVLRATYGCVVVDEYQDCSPIQHHLVVELSRVLSTFVLGDPLQAIFDFRGPTVDWRTQVLPHFPQFGELRVPWRWRHSGSESLGAWLLSVRERLQEGLPIDLRSAPSQVRWVRLCGDARRDERTRNEAAHVRPAHADGRVLIVCDSAKPRAHRRRASRVRGAMLVESGEFNDILRCIKSSGCAEPSLATLLELLGSTMTGLSGAKLLQRVCRLQKGRSRSAASALEVSALNYVQKASCESAIAFIEACEADASTRTFRPTAVQLLKSTLREMAASGCTMHSAFCKVRERNRHISRGLPYRAVGSTLLLKGLEADTVVILEPETLDGRNLYVALTRGARKVIVCSTTHLLQPARGMAARAGSSDGSDA